MNDITAPPVGSVAHTLFAMRGVWHDHVEIFDLSGRPLADDPQAGTPGPAPFDNLVYVDFDGEQYRQTNVTFRGRPTHARSFSGRLVGGVLVFDRLGPGDPEHIGVSGGPGILFFAPRTLTDAWGRYHEPDCVRLIAPGQRTRTTLLYRGGSAVRTLTAYGTRLSPTCDRRAPFDPRGADGPAHAEREDTLVFHREDTKRRNEGS
jgi:hypothetical protein